MKRAINRLQNVALASLKPYLVGSEENPAEGLAFNLCIDRAVTNILVARVPWLVWDTDFGRYRLPRLMNAGVQQRTDS